MHCPSSAVRFMHSTQGRIHLQSSCQCRKFIWSELRFPRTLPPPPHAKFTGNFSSERSKYVTGGGSNNREVPPLIQKLTGPTAYNWQTIQSEAVESTSTSFKMEQAPEMTDCILAESIEVLEAFHTTLSFILVSERAQSLQLLRNIFIRIPKENRRMFQP